MFKGNFQKLSYWLLKIHIYEVERIHNRALESKNSRRFVTTRRVLWFLKWNLRSLFWLYWITFESFLLTSKILKYISMKWSGFIVGHLNPKIAINSQSQEEFCKFLKWNLLSLFWLYWIIFLKIFSIFGLVIFEEYYRGAFEF